MGVKADDYLIMGNPKNFIKMAYQVLMWLDLFYISATCGFSWFLVSYELFSRCCGVDFGNMNSDHLCEDLFFFFGQI